MPTPNDDDLLWDEPTKAERVAPKRSGFRPKGYDVVADVVDDDEGGGGKLLWILGGVGGGVAVLAVLLAVLFWGADKQPEVAANAPPPAQPAPPVDAPVNPDPVPPPLPPGLDDFFPRLPPAEGLDPAAPPILPPFTPTLDPAPADTLLKPVEVERMTPPGAVEQLAYSAKHGLLVGLRADAVWVYDRAGRRVISEVKPVNRFTDVSVTPDESAVFVADYGGEQAGFDGRGPVSHVHRFDVATRQWTTLVSRMPAFRIEAVDVERALLLEADQWVDLWLVELNLNQKKVVPLAQAGGGLREGDIEYDPATGRIYHGGSGISVFQLSSRTLRSVKGADFGADGGHGRMLLAPDGRGLFVSGYRYRTDDVKKDGFRFPEPVRAAGRDAVIGESGNYYRARDGKALGSLMAGPAAACGSRTGKTTWLYDARKNAVVRFDWTAGDGVPVAAKPLDAVQYTDPLPPGTRTVATRVGKVNYVNRHYGMAYSIKYDKLLVASQKKFEVFDGTNGGRDKTVDLDECSGVSLAPNQTDVWTGASKFGLKTMELHRLDLATGEWRKATTENSYIVCGLGADRALVRSEGTPSLAVVSIAGDGKMTELSRSSPVGGRGHLLDPVRGRIYAAHDEVLSAVSAHQLAGDAILFRELQHRLAHADRDTRAVLSSDGRHVFLGRNRHLADDLARAPVQFLQPVIAASRDLAVGASGTLYHIDTAEVVGRLGFKPENAIVSADGLTLWAYDNQGGRIVRFALTDEKGKPGDPTVAPPDPPVAPPVAEAFPAAFERPKTVAPDIRQAGLVKKTAFPTATSTRQLAYLDKEDLLLTFHHQKFDAINRKGASLTTAAAAFAEANFSVAPDQSAVFLMAGDLHRYDPDKNVWETAPLRDNTKIQTKVLAVGGRHLILHERGVDGKAVLAVYRWDREVNRDTDKVTVKLARLSEAAVPEQFPTLAYDPVGRVVFACGSAAFGRTVVVRRFRLTADKLTEVGKTDVDVGGDPLWGRPHLSADGGRLHVGKRAVGTADGKLLPIAYPQEIVAATRDVALGGKGDYFDAATGKRLGRIEAGETGIDLATVTPDGTGFWLCGREGGLQRFDTTAAPPPDAPPKPLDPTDWLPAKAAPPAFPEAAGTLTSLSETGSFTAAGIVPKRLQPVDARGLLIVQDDKNQLHVLDAKTGAAVTEPVTDKFQFSLSVAPDQSAVFATTGEQLYRYDVAAKKWEKKPYPATTVWALSGELVLSTTRYLTRRVEQHDVRIAKWTDAAEPVDGVRKAYFAYPDWAGYNPRTGLVYVVERERAFPANKLTLREFAVSGTEFVEKRNVPVGVHRTHVWDSYAFSPDGTRLYANGLVLALDREKDFVSPSKFVRGASRDLIFAVQEPEWYRADTGAVAGKFPFALAEVRKFDMTGAAVAADGRSVWAYDATKAVYRRFAVTDAKVPVQPPPVADDWSPPKYERPTLAAALGKQTTVSRIAAVPNEKGLTVTALLHADKHNRLFASCVNDGIVVLDATTLQPVAGGKKFDRALFVEPSLAPDQSALFVLERTTLWRYDLAKGTWDSRPTTADRVAAVAGDRILLTSPNPNWTTTVSLSKWGTDALIPTASDKIDAHLGSLHYDPAAGTAFAFLKAGPGKKEGVARVVLRDGKLTVAEVRLAKNGPGLNTRVVMSWDFARMHTIMAVIDPVTGAVTERTQQAADLLAASRDLAFTGFGTAFAGRDPLRSVNLPNAMRTATVSPDGQTLFAVADNQFQRYQLGEPTPPGKFADFKPTLFPRPELPAPPLAKLTEVVSRAGPQFVQQLLYADKHDVLVMRDGPFGLRLETGTTGAAVRGPAALGREAVIAAALAPDQAALFVVTTKDVYRYDFAAKEWQSRVNAGIGTVHAVDGTTFLAVVHPPAEAAKLAVLRWDKAGLTALGEAALPGLHVWSGYDAASASLYLLSRPEKPGESHRLQKYPVGGKPFAPEWTTDHDGRLLLLDSPRAPLTWDGRFLLFGPNAYATADGKKLARQARDNIRATARDVAVTDMGALLDPQTAKEIGRLPYQGELTAVAVAADGKSLWVYRPGVKKLTQYVIEAGVIAPPPPKKEPPKVEPPKKDPPSVEPPKNDPPGASGRPKLPYAAGTQTTVTEVNRIPIGLVAPIRFVAAEPAGVLATWNPQAGALLKLYDPTTKKLLGLPSPTRELSVELFAPPDRTALFLHDRKKVYRMKPDRKGWDEGDLPADARHVVALDKDRLVVAAAVTGTGSTFHELTWADGKLTGVRQTKVPLMVGPPQVAPAGDRLFVMGRSLYGQTDFCLNEFVLTDKGPVAGRAVVLRNQKQKSVGAFRLSWDGSRAVLPDSVVALDGSKPAETDPPAGTVTAVSRDLLFTVTGEYFALATGKPVGKFDHAVRVGEMTPDGKAVWFFDPDKKELVKYALTDGK